MDATNQRGDVKDEPGSAPAAERPPTYEDTPAIRRAREYGIDITLLEAMLDLTVEERLRRLDASVRFFHAVDHARGRKP